MANNAAGVNGLVKKEMNSKVIALLKFASLAERGAVKTFTEKSTKILELTAHGLVSGNQAILTKLPTETAGLVTGRIYTVKKVGVNEIELEEHFGGGAVTWTALGGSVELQLIRECASIKARVGVTLVVNGDGVTEEAASKTVETNAAQTGEKSITDVIYYQTGTEALTKETAVSSKVLEITGSKALGYENGVPVLIVGINGKTTGSESNFTIGTQYYVVGATTNTFELATSPGGTGVEVTGAALKATTKVQVGEILAVYQLPSKLEEAAAAIVTILSTKQNNLVSP